MMRHWRGGGVGRVSHCLFLVAFLALLAGSASAQERSREFDVGPVVDDGGGSEVGGGFDTGGVVGIGRASGAHEVDDRRSVDEWRSRNEGRGFAVGDEVDEDLCEGNRRCRLQRFRMQQTARRAAAIEREIRQHEAERQARLRTLQIALPVRETKRIELDGFINANQVFGNGFRAAFGNAVFRGEAQAAWVDLSGGWGGGYINADGLSFTGRARWLIGKGQGVPYLAAGATVYGLDVYGWSHLAGDMMSERFDFRGRVHALTGAVGFDFMARTGFHVALEVQYVHPIYVRVRDPESGLYDTGQERSLRDAFRSQPLGLSVQGGWAF